MRVVARMTSDRQPSNSYEYLRTLRPEARAMQAAELERGVLAGEESPRNALILQELRRTIPRAPPPAARMGEVARMFLRRSGHSVNDDSVDQKRAGRIARVSLEPVWGGCRRRSRRRAPISNARFPSTTGSKPNSAPHTARSRHSSHPRGDGVGDRGRQGAPQARRAGRHAACARGSGDAVRHLGQSRLARADCPATCASSGIANADVFLHGFILIMGRLAPPWHLIRLATRAADTAEAHALRRRPTGARSPLSTARSSAWSTTCATT